MNILVRVLRDITTNKNDKDYCHSKVLSFIAFIGFLFISFYSIWRGDKFDAMNWSGGAGAIILAGAGGAKIKETTEPQ